MSSHLMMNHPSKVVRQNFGRKMTNLSRILEDDYTTDKRASYLVGKRGTYLVGKRASYLVGRKRRELDLLQRSSQ